MHPFWTFCCCVTVAEEIIALNQKSIISLKETFARVLEGTCSSLIWWKEGWGGEKKQEMVWKTGGFIGHTGKSLLDLKANELSRQMG